MKNMGNGISEVLKINIFWGSMPQTPSPGSSLCPLFYYTFLYVPKRKNLATPLYGKKLVAEIQPASCSWRGYNTCPRQTCKNLCPILSNTLNASARVSSLVPNTLKQRPSAFIVLSCLEPLMKHEAQVFDITQSNETISDLSCSESHIWPFFF